MTEAADSMLSLMIPVEITDTVLYSTTVAETDYSAWSNGTTYSIGNKVIRGHRIYESAQNSNLNKDPTDINNRTGSTIWWIDVSATNAHKMFDNESTSATVAATSLTVVLRPGFISGLYAGGLVGDTATITVKDSPGGTTVYSATIQLENSYRGDYWEYFFAPFSQQRDLVIDDIPPYYNCEVTFTLSISSGNVECGMFQVGEIRPVGVLQYGGSVRPKSYSAIKEDEFGNVEVRKRRKARDATYQVIIDKTLGNGAMDALTSVLDVPTVVIATTFDDYSWLRTFGLVSSDMSPDNYSENVINITVKGMV